jgi:hypothetical protein
LENVDIFYGWNILPTFGIFNYHLAHIVFVWHISPKKNLASLMHTWALDRKFVQLFRADEKSGNPTTDRNFIFYLFFKRYFERFKLSAGNEGVGDEPAVDRDVRRHRRALRRRRRAQAHQVSRSFNISSSLFTSLFFFFFYGPPAPVEKLGLIGWAPHQRSRAGQINPISFYHAFLLPVILSSSLFFSLCYSYVYICTSPFC